MGKHKPKNKRNDDVNKSRPSVRRRVAAAKKSARFAQRAKCELSTQEVLATENTGYLRAEGPFEHTSSIRQRDIRAAVDRTAASRGAFELNLADAKLYPYVSTRYSRSGRSLLLASAKGHVATWEWRTSKLHCELYLQERVRAATFLHSDRFFALAQRQYVYIYDQSGIQVHVLRRHRDAGTLVFLPHHLLLASSTHAVSPLRQLVYTDTSTGHIIAKHELGARKVNLRPVTGLDYNARNGVIVAGHTDGVVSLWSPNVSKPLARLFAQRGGVRHIAVDPARNAMATLAHDGTLREFDLRKFEQRSECSAMPLASAMAYSQRSLLAVAGGPTVQVWAPTNDRKPYMIEHYARRRPTALSFCPYEDILSVAHKTGLVTMLVPGAGEPTFDSRAPNPYETRGQRRENEVRALLDQLPPETIALDPTRIGTLDDDPRQRQQEFNQASADAAAAARERSLRVRKTKGRNTVSKRVKRREHHRLESRKLTIEKRRSERRQVRKLAGVIEREREREEQSDVPEQKMALPKALNRFLPRSKADNKR